MRSRQQRIASIALAEVDPARFDKFEPITKGPIVAILGLAALGSIAAVYMVGQKIAGLFRRR